MPTSDNSRLVHLACCAPQRKGPVPQNRPEAQQARSKRLKDLTWTWPWSWKGDTVLYPCIGPVLAGHLVYCRYSIILKAGRKEESERERPPRKLGRSCSRGLRGSPWLSASPSLRSLAPQPELALNFAEATLSESSRFDLSVLQLQAGVPVPSYTVLGTEPGTQ